MRWMAIAACLTGALVQAGAAQEAQSGAARSTLEGAYTTAQATRGRDTYAGMCQGCHTPASHSGSAFLAAWGGRPLWELVGYVSANMPKSDPGALTPQEYADVVAYLLQLNRMPAGKTELRADSAVLKAIRFDTVSSAKRP